MTCSILACSEVSKLILYLAKIFIIGLSFIHHWLFGIRCLSKRDKKLIMGSQTSE